MELKDYINVIKKRKWWVIGSILLVTGAALLYSFFLQNTVYQATSWVVIKEKPLESTVLEETISELSTQPERSLQTQVELLKTKEMAKKVVDALQLELSPSGLMAKISVEPLSNTNIIAIKATDRYPELARDIANQYAVVYQEWRRSENVKEIAKARAEVWEVLQSTKDEAIDLSRQIESRFGNQAIPEELKVEQQIAYNYYVDLQRIYRELSISEDLMSGGLEVIVDDDVPTSPVNPRPVRNGVLAFFLGTILGLGLAFLVDYLDDAIESREEVQRLYDAPVLGEIPRYRDLEGEQRRSSLVMVSEPKAPISESFRALRTNIQYVNYERQLKAIMVTSAGPGAGKTFVLANLAVSLAEAGHRVIVVCCDMRRPTMHEFFHLSNAEGLSTVLVGKMTLEEALKSPGKRNLQVLTSGPLPPNPSELIGSRRMNELLARAKAMADFVLIDTPPVLAVSDAAVLAPRTDGVLVVCGMGVAKRDDARKTRDLLQQVNSNVIGVVLNYMEEARNYGYYYYYNSTAK
ncbi:MAG: polysaccharide biosynthesis tyrosine autokinase [Actinomycetota bacterium]